jgi:hypothetical protein
MLQELQVPGIIQYIDGGNVRDYESRKGAAAIAAAETN